MMLQVEIKVVDLQIGVEVAELMDCSPERLKTELLEATKEERGRIFVKTQRLLSKHLLLGRA